MYMQVFTTVTDMTSLESAAVDALVAMDSTGESTLGKGKALATLSGVRGWGPLPLAFHAHLKVNGGNITTCIYKSLQTYLLYSILQLKAGLNATGRHAYQKRRHLQVTIG